MLGRAEGRRFLGEAGGVTVLGRAWAVAGVGEAGRGVCVFQGAGCGSCAESGMRTGEC